MDSTPPRRGARRTTGTPTPAAALLGGLLLALLFACAPEELPHPNDDLFAEAEDGVRVPAVYLLVDQLGFVAADPEPHPGQPLAVPRYEVAKDQRRALYQHPPSEYRFPGVPSGPQAVLHLAPVLAPKSWETDSNGARFEVECRDPDGRRVPLTALDVAPAQRPEDRVWHDLVIPLSGCGEPMTELTLRTGCGPRGDCGADWAAWGNPRVLFGRTIAPKPARLALLISIDTLRPDHLSVYGYARDTSPALARLAADSVVFETAVSTSPWTIPSHATMLTSTFPRVHQAGTKTPIGASAVLLSEVLLAAGWQTAGFVDTPYLNAEHGFDRGFSHFDDDAPPAGDYRRGAEVGRERLVRWLASADARPAFVFWHLMDAHGPYGAPAPHAGRFRSEVAPDPGDNRLAELGKLAYHEYLGLERFDSFDDLVATYDEGIAFVDATIGRLLDVLRTAGLYDDALIVVTSDHGESFLDHGIWVGHGLFLTDDEVRVPLFVKLPGNANAGTRVGALASLVDLAPTILEAVGLPPESAFQGESLLGRRAAPSQRAFGYSSNTRASFVRTEGHKYITGQDPKRLAKHLRSEAGAVLPAAPQAERQLYDLVRDPGEQTPLTREAAVEHQQRLQRDVNRHAAAVARRRADGASPAGSAEVSAEERQRLRALGYTD